MDQSTFQQYIDANRSNLLDCIYPFWQQNHVDHEHGGFFNYLGEDGTVLFTDKNVRQLGRFALLYAQAFNELEKRPLWLDLAFHGIRFLEDHCFDRRDGRMYYEVTREGAPVRKRRYVITEHYTIMAYIQLFLATGDGQWKEKAENSTKRC